MMGSIKMCTCCEALWQALMGHMQAEPVQCARHAGHGFALQQSGAHILLRKAHPPQLQHYRFQICASTHSRGVGARLTGEGLFPYITVGVNVNKFTGDGQCVSYSVV